MAWYWNEWVYIVLWILIIVGILTGALVISKTEEFQDVQDPLDLALFFQPYQPEDVCEIYAYVYPKVVASEMSDGTNRRSDEEARERADKLLKQQIPGTLLKCPIQYPKEKNIDVVFPYLTDLPDSFLATLYATLIFSTTKLQKSLVDLTKALQSAANAKKEGFADICSKEEADAKRAAEKEKEKESCVLPDAIPVEERLQKILGKMAIMSKTYLDWRNGFISEINRQLEGLKKPYAEALMKNALLKKKLEDKKPDEISDEDRTQQSEMAETVGAYEGALLDLNFTKSNLTQSIPSLVKACKEIIPKLTALQKNLENGNYSVPAEGFENFFQSPLR
jgi:hypothetical protein